MADNSTQQGNDTIATKDLGGGVKAALASDGFGLSPGPVAVPAATSATTLAAALATRFGMTIVNDSTNTLWLKYGSNASQTDWTYKLPPGAVWEMPKIYRGIVTGIWDGTNGNARVTETT